MRAIWKGAVAFGLVNVPVKLYAATGETGVTLHQVHGADGGRIRYRKVCSVCGDEVQFADIAKGYETDDGQMVVLTDEDLDDLPLATEREIAVEEFVPADQVDPIMLAKTYYLEPEKTAAKPYALLREALRTTDRMAVVKVALRQRESMAVLRVRGDVICLQTLLWPDEIRAADFPILDAEVAVRPQELTMAASLVESLAADFDPSEFADAYQGALESLIETKVSSGRTVPRQAAGESPSEGAEVLDLLSALQRSVERARTARGEAPEPEPAKPARSTKARSASTAPAAVGASDDGAAAGAKKTATRGAARASASAGGKDGATGTPRSTRSPHAPKADDAVPAPDQAPAPKTPAKAAGRRRAS